MKSLLLSFFAIAIFGYTASTDFCRIEWHRECPGDQRYPNMADFKDMIVEEHNTYRNRLAGGKIKGLLPATRMRTMQWDEHLAQKAVMNLRQCKSQVEKCNATESEPPYGQNVGAIYSAANVFIGSRIRTIIKEWWQQHSVASQAVINKYPRMRDAPFSNFTVMAIDRSSRVGCALLSVNGMVLPDILLTCNYARDNAIGRRTYDEGVAASKCKYGRNYIFKNLCSLAENDYN